MKLTVEQKKTLNTQETRFTSDMSQLLTIIWLLERLLAG